jgi:hypothetical protein
MISWPDWGGPREAPPRRLFKWVHRDRTPYRGQWAYFLVQRMNAKKTRFWQHADAKSRVFKIILTWKIPKPCVFAFILGVRLATAAARLATAETTSSRIQRKNTRFWKHGRQIERKNPGFWNLHVAQTPFFAGFSCLQVEYRLTWMDPVSWPHETTDF